MGLDRDYTNNSKTNSNTFSRYIISINSSGTPLDSTQSIGERSAHV